MFTPPVTNLHPQWPPVPPPFVWPGFPFISSTGAPQYRHIYHQYHSTTTMPRGGSYRPSYDDPHSSSNAYGRQPNRPRPGMEQMSHPQAQSRRAPTAQRVSEAKLSSLLDWLEYRDDNTNKQIPVTNAPSTEFEIRTRYPASISPVRNSQPLSFNPQASSFLPAQRSVNEYKFMPSYRIDKISRYNLRQRNDGQVRSYAAGTSEHVVESIEHREEPVNNRAKPLWRGGRRGRRQTTPFRPTPSRDTPDRVVTPPPEPVVSRVYLSRACAPPQTLPHSQKLLVVLDLNGALVAREKGAPQHMIKRPGVDALLEYLFNNHVVMVCTSATAHNARDMVKKLLSEEHRDKLVTIRSRDSFGLTPAQYASKVQIYKNLEDIWNDPLVDNAIPLGAQSWSMVNTVLVDDSTLKAKAQPHNLIQVPEFEYTTISGNRKTKQTITAREEAIMKSVREKLEVLKHQANVASLIRLWQEGEKDAPGIVDEKVDQGKKVGLKYVNESAVAADYPTPNSLDSPSAQEAKDEEEYESLEEVELVFRGRREMGKGVVSLPKASAISQDSGKIEAADGAAQDTTHRSSSPVTEEHFSWLKDA